MAATKNDRFLTIKQVCELWGIHRTTLHRQLKAGTVRVRPAALVGKRIRWRASEIVRDIATASIAADVRRQLRDSGRSR